MDGAGRLEHLADVRRPGRVLALGNPEAHLHIVAGVLAFGLDALNQLAELVLVESLFLWPGVGRAVAQSLVAPSVFTPGGAQTETYFLHPELLAALVTLLTAAFFLTDVVASLAARAADPRLRQVDALTA